MKSIPLILAFVACTVIGTLSHEAGHFIAATALGYEAKLHYNSVSWNNSHMKHQIDSLSKLLEITPESTTEYSIILQVWKEHQIKLQPDTIIILSGGPLQTLITSIIGFSVLFIRRKRKVFKTLDWAMVFFALFISRMIFNPIVSGIKYMTGKSDTLFSGDEYHLAIVVNVPPATLVIPLFILAIAVCTVVVFRFIPIDLRLRFIICGFIGSGVGYILWMVLLGPIILL